MRRKPGLQQNLVHQHVKTAVECSCTAETLTATTSGLSQVAASRHAARSTHSPICRINPLSSAIGMKIVGRDGAALGVLPAQQRFEADDLCRISRCICGW